VVISLLFTMRPTSAPMPAVRAAVFKQDSKYTDSTHRQLGGRYRRDMQLRHTIRQNAYFKSRDNEYCEQERLQETLRRVYTRTSASGQYLAGTRIAYRLKHFAERAPRTTTTNEYNSMRQSLGAFRCPVQYTPSECASSRPIDSAVAVAFVTVPTVEEEAHWLAQPLEWPSLHDDNNDGDTRQQNHQLISDIVYTSVDIHERNWVLCDACGKPVQTTCIGGATPQGDIYHVYTHVDCTRCKTVQ
jgi:hypothetical protein